MANRVTNAEVVEVVGESDDYVQFIDTAHIFVDANLLGKGLSDPILKQLELYLAAHFTYLSIREGPLAAQNIDVAVERYHDTYGPGLKSSRFGQTAIIIDTTGTLSEIADRAENLGKKDALFAVI